MIIQREIIISKSKSRLYFLLDNDRSDVIFHIIRKELHYFRMYLQNTSYWKKKLGNS
jgi:hypothetical protein